MMLRSRKLASGSPHVTRYSTREAQSYPQARTLFSAPGQRDGAAQAGWAAPAHQQV